MSEGMFKIITIVVLLPLTVLGSCTLKYEKNLSNKPTIYVTTAISSAICGLQNDEVNSLTEWSYEGSSVRGINYDSQQKKLIYLSSQDRENANLNLVSVNDQQPKVVFRQSNLTSIDGNPLRSGIEIVDLTYDWISKNAYLSLRDFVVAVNVQNPSPGTVTLVSNAKHVLSLVVHPNAGYLFYVDINIVYTETIPRVNSTIYRANLDGSNAMPLVEVDDYVISLAIDFYEDKLYWAIPSESLIQYSNLDGTDVQGVRGHQVRFNIFNDGSRSIDVDDKFVYYLSSNSPSIRRFRKNDKRDDVDFHLFMAEPSAEPQSHSKIPITEILVYDLKKQGVKENHPCAIKNGSCEKFCFAVPENGGLGKICKCADGEKLAKDGVSCEK